MKECSETHRVHTTDSASPPDSGRVQTIASQTTSDTIKSSFAAAGRRVRVRLGKTHRQQSGDKFCSGGFHKQVTAMKREWSVTWGKWESRKDAAPQPYQLLRRLYNCTAWGLQSWPVNMYLWASRSWCTLTVPGSEMNHITHTCPRLAFACSALFNLFPFQHCHCFPNTVDK